MNDDPQYRDLANTGLATLRWLETHGSNLDASVQQLIAGQLQTMIALLDQAQYSFERGSAVTTFLSAVETFAADSPVVTTILAPAHQPAMRGLPQIDEEAGQKLLLAAAAALRALAGQSGQPAPDPEPRPPSDYRDPATTIPQVMDRLRRNWHAIPDDVQAHVENLLGELEQKIYEARLDFERGAAATTFLEGIDNLAPARGAVEDILERTRIPRRRGGKLSEGDAQDMMEGIWGRPAMIGPGDDELMMMEEESPGESLTPRGFAPPSEESPEPADQAVELHTKIQFPGEVSIFDEVVPLIVQLTPQEAQITIAKSIVKLQFTDITQPEQVEIVIRPEGFSEITGDTTRTILAYATRASQPAVFLLQPQSAGRKRIVVDFRHKGRLAGTTFFYSEIKDKPPLNRDLPAPLEPFLTEPAGRPDGDGQRLSRLSLIEGDGSLPPYQEIIAAPIVLSPNPPAPVDLELRITLSADKKTLSYELHSSKASVGYHWKTAGFRTLQSEPRYYLESTFRHLNRLARADDDDRSEEESQASREKLVEIGQNLYEELFSPDMKREYQKIRELRANNTIKTLLITSDEPWIPWELIKPFESDPDTGETILDDDFLCAQFQLSRWLAGGGVPDTVSIQSARLIAPDGNLPYVEQERNYFIDELPRRLPIAVGPLIENSGEVLDALRAAQVQLYHFACHGNFDSTTPNESTLMLKDEAFTPSQVIGRQRAGVTKSKPLVFLNACHSAQIGFTLTQLGGWAERFVKAGASAFVGTLWEVNDKLAAEFAIHFYNELWAGKLLGEAFHSARQHIRSEDDANPTWLAYVLYADPNGSAKLS